MNAEIYREIANTIQYDPAIAGESLSGLSSLSHVINQLEADWNTIEALKEQIKRVGF
ncbi:hypothetical protein [Candidatus Venteria ishoeyi]|uniref:Uncharacterized protein n=1 Tax=Candidatus Venteria ishoeyi TaxID=1899563 RepID=A0A1H6FDC2_9GAMM|nr:hypothetical protein [Candidatus Venteria ishoeyi]SEH07643.1 Uncharacterised protein [Candidatus Venteria ishoeyi]